MSGEANGDAAEESVASREAGEKSEAGGGGESDGSGESGESVVDALFSVTGGAAVVVTGTLAGMALELSGRGLFTRAFSPEEYGLFSLAFTVASILAVVATLGLRNGVTRQVAYHGAGGAEKADGSEEDSKNGSAGRTVTDETVLTPASIVTWGLVAAVVASLVVCAGLFALAEPLASLFGHPEYALAFRVAAVSIPGLAVVRVCTAVFRGFGRTGERVAFQELLQKGALPAILAAVVWAEWGLVAALLAFPASLALTAVAYLLYTVRADPGDFRGAAAASLRRPREGYALLAFSFPLLFASLLIQIMSWTDILMLGYFKTAAAVGIYDGVRPLVRTISIIWGSMIFLYTPAVSEFAAEGSGEAVRRVYFALTKWFASVTFPVATTFLLFPEVVLGAVFGPEYRAGALALRVLAVAYFLGNVMGPNGATLTALGYTRAVMWANLVAAVGNVLLNVWLIPPYCIVGAAVATAVALVVRNAIRVVLVYRFSGAHSLRAPMLVPMGITVAAAVLAALAAGDAVASPLGLVPFLAGLFAVYYGAMVGLGYTEPADRELLARVHGRLTRR
ncbi:flippase [Haloparvum sedimenti]|uniref:flippase n=1 Tax=Haloparvum sedimenti TaxID=1678448 RepID=UPI00071E8F2B|nr:flippase [Haloparvum sedimenti]